MTFPCFDYWLLQIFSCAKTAVKADYIFYSRLTNNAPFELDKFRTLNTYWGPFLSPIICNFLIVFLEEPLTCFAQIGLVHFFSKNSFKSGLKDRQLGHHSHHWLKSKIIHRKIIWDALNSDQSSVAESKLLNF